MTDSGHARIPDTTLQALERELVRITQRRVALTLDARLREDLGLDSLHLIEVAVWCHEHCGINLGERGATTGKTLHTVRDLLNELNNDV